MNNSKKLFLFFIFIMFATISCLDSTEEQIELDETTWQVKKIGTNNSEVINEVIVFYKKSNSYYVRNNSNFVNFIGNLQKKTLTFTIGNENGSITFHSDKSGTGTSSNNSTNKNYSYDLNRIN